MQIDFYNSPLGKIRLTAQDDALTGLIFVDKDIAPEGKSQAIEQAKSWLDIYFSGKAPDFTPSISLHGTEFQRSVWRHLMEIGYGSTISYGQLAAVIARERCIEKMSARAVGTAAGKNPILLIVPCHRLIGSDGSLTGFAAGIDRKKKLLEIEAGNHK